jgi:DUF4097 and DUF4098 domain-containing protein YvlB
MKAKAKWLIFATVVLVIGLIIFGGAMSMLGWDFSKLSTIKYETNEHTVSESFGGVYVETHTADVELLPSEDGVVRVVCFEQKNVKHEVTVEGGMLTIKVQDMRKWYEHIGINFKTATVKIYIPEGDYGMLVINSTTGDVTVNDGYTFDGVGITATTGDVRCYADTTGDCNIYVTTGDVHIEDITARALNVSSSTGSITVLNAYVDTDVDVEVTTGGVKLASLVAGNVSVETDTGRVTLASVIAGKLSVYTDAGDVRLEDSDAAEIFIETDTGDVTGTLLSEKIFITECNTGMVRVPHSTTGDRCEITTDTGDIIITINQK